MFNFRKTIYKLSNKKDLAPIIPINCNENISFTGSGGIFIFEVEMGNEFGTTTINYEAYDVPDRFQISYGGVLVADSKYVGNDGPAGLIGQVYYNVPEYIYNGTIFVTNGITRDITITSNDVANGSTEPTSGTGTLSFNKGPSIGNTKATITVYAPVGNTQWSINTTCPIGTGFKSIQLSTGNTSSIACSNFANPSISYIPSSETFETTNSIYHDYLGNSSPVANWFSNGTISRYWNGTSFTSQSNC